MPKVDKSKLIQLKLTLLKKITRLLQEEKVIVTDLQLRVIDASTKGAPMARGTVTFNFQSFYDEETLAKMQDEDEELPDEEYLVGGVPKKAAIVRVQEQEE
jgi:hypothetical protein